MLNGMSSVSHLLAEAALVLVLVQHLARDRLRCGLQLRRATKHAPIRVYEQEDLQRPSGAASATAAGVLDDEVKAAGNGCQGCRQ